MPNQPPEDYVQLLADISGEIDKDLSEGRLRGDAPVSIDKCYKARAFTRSDPASYGYAAFGLIDVKFVDLIVTLRKGSRSWVRTLVVQEPDKKWYVVPVPHAFPLLSDGLAAEVPSPAN